MSDLITFRDRMAQAAPRWLRGWWGSRLLYALGIIFDAVCDWASYAVHVRYPSWCAVHMPDALAAHGRNRGIRRGFAETAASYAARLAMWWPTRKQRGSLYALMDQLAGYMAGHEVKIRCVNLNGAWYTRNADGTREYHRATPSNWSWDAYTGAFSRYWVIIYPPSSLWTSRGTWGSHSTETWGDASVNATWGSTMTAEQAATIMAIITEWNPPHARCSHVALALDPASFDPTAAAGSAGLPSASEPWINWGLDDAGDYAAIRLSTGRYGAWE